MAKVSASILHDETGRIVAVARPAAGTKAIALGGAGQSILKTEVDESAISRLVTGSHRVDIEKHSIVAHSR